MVFFPTEIGHRAHRRDQDQHSGSSQSRQSQEPLPVLPGGRGFFLWRRRLRGVQGRGVVQVVVEQVVGGDLEYLGQALHAVGQGLDGPGLPPGDSLARHTQPVGQVLLRQVLLFSQFDHLFGKVHGFLLLSYRSAWQK